MIITAGLKSITMVFRRTNDMYQNLDLNINKFFVTKDYSNLVTNITQLKNSRLDRNFYFRPSGCPLINVNDFTAGSCFEDYVIPTGSYQFESDSVRTVDKNLPINSYIDELFVGISARIQSIYQAHDTVTLAYSGGIDSMVLLGFIQSQGLLPRTDVVCFKNQTQSNPTCLHQDPTKLEKVTDLLNQIGQLARSVTWLDITIADITHGFNHQQLEHVKCYATNAVIRNSTSSAFIFGHHGNQVLLHKNIFLDELVLSRESAQEEIVNLLAGPTDFYTQSIIGYDVSAPKIGIEQRHMLMKPWSLLNTPAQTVYSPLGNADTFDQLRRLDYSQISVDTIANATVAKELIARTAPYLLPYISVEGVKDGDNLEEAVIPLSLLNPDLLTVPLELNHNAEGLDYIQHEIAQAQQTQYIPINSLVTIKALNWLALL